MIVSMLTTIDNPFSPFDDYPQWLAFDLRLGYNTTSLLARIVQNSNDLSERDQVEAIEMAIDEIVTENVFGVHKKVTKEYPDSEMFDLEPVMGE